MSNELRHGDTIIIGGEHSHSCGYDRFVGCQARILSISDTRGVVVQLLSIPEGAPPKYIGHNVYIRKEDCLPYVEAEGVPAQESEGKEVNIGSIIRIGGTYAERMDYVGAVGFECAIHYIAASFVQGTVLTGPMAGKVVDVHMEDVTLDKVTLDKKQSLLVVLHEKKQIVYVPKDKIGDEETKKRLFLRLQSLGVRKAEGKLLFVTDVSHAIDTLGGYKVTHVDDVPFPIERKRHESGQGNGSEWTD